MKTNKLVTLQVSRLVMSFTWLHSVTFTPLVRNSTRELELIAKNCLLTPLTHPTPTPLPADPAPPDGRPARGQTPVLRCAVRRDVRCCKGAPAAVARRGGGRRDG